MLSIRSRLRPVLVALGCATVVLGLVAGPASAAGVARLAAAAASPDAAGTIWLCQPRTAGDPCEAPLTTTVVNANGSRSVEHLTDAASPRADCFFVYPTVSTEPGTNSDLVVGPEEVGAAVAEASPFSQVCRVWAPMYRQETEGDLVDPGGTINDHQAVEATAYASVLSAWKDYLANDNDGRPVIFIGHSQGAAMLIRLLSGQIDRNPELRSKMVSAIILGGNVEVPKGKLVGGSFKHIPACRSATDTGCVIAYSSFSVAPPADSQFGRPGQGVSLQSNQTATAGLQVLCTNPAALGGGSAVLQDRFYATPKKVLGSAITTPWVAYPGLYRAQCKNAGGATWLQVTAAPDDPRPTVSPTLGPLWGLHGDDASLAMGSLVQDVSRQVAAFKG